MLKKKAPLLLVRQKQKKNKALEIKKSTEKKTRITSDFAKFNSPPSSKKDSFDCFERAYAEYDDSISRRTAKEQFPQRKKDIEARRKKTMEKALRSRGVSNKTQNKTPIKTKAVSSKSQKNKEPSFKEKGKKDES